MTDKLTPTDIQFLFDNILLGDTPLPGADPLAPDGIRTIDGTQNNITGLTILDQYGNLVDSGTFGNVNQFFINVSSTVGPNSYGPNMFVTDASPRVISNLIVDQTAANPATVGASLLALGDPSVDRTPESSLFTFFGQFFDHGLDFISKQGSGVIMVPIAPTDPLWDPTPGAFNMMPVTRAETDVNGDTINTTAPYVEQSQTYGSSASTTFYLKEYDANGQATGDLVQGANGMGSWLDIKDNANLWARAQIGADPATEMLTDADILDVPDPTFWDPLMNAGLGGFMPGAGTGQAFVADIAHNANPSGGLTPDADSVINPNGFGSPPPAPGEYDNELLEAHLVSGDPRANENTALTAIHVAFHAEHTRLVAEIKDWVQQQNQIDPTFAGQWTGDMYFEAAKVANEMQYQHVVFDEFARRMSPNIDAFASYKVDINPNITTEFSQAVYRLGHSQLTDDVKAIDASGQVTDYSLIQAFLNPELFEQVGAADFAKGLQFEQGSRIDEFVVDSLRNFLVGLPLDLAAINIARGRDVGLPTLNELRADLFAQTGEASLEAYDSWADFGANLLNPASLVNFIAAYSNEATIAAARAAAEAGTVDYATDYAALRAAAALQMDDPVFMGVGGDDGYNLIDLWIGGLAEVKVPLGLLGSTFDFVFAQQIIALQDGDRFYYLDRIAGNLLAQIEGQTLSDILARGTGAIHLYGDPFGTPDALIELGTLAVDHLIKTPTELNDFIAEIIGGTNANNMIYGGAGNDSIYGDGGNDVLYAGANDDFVYGGDGDDVIYGEVGFDRLRGDDGNDILHGGADDDKLNGGKGDDVLYGDQGLDELLGDDGNDTIFGGNQNDEIFGGDGDDVLYGDDGDDSIDGEEGNDILYGGRGDDIMTGGADDDILIGGSGGDSMDGGLGGYDIASYETWLESLPLGTGVGLTINMLDSVLSTGDARDDTYLDIEAVRGTNFDDIIVGNDLGITLVGGFGDDNITGGLLDDTLIGSEGNDSLFGGGGIDTALVRGLEADFTLSAAVGGLNLMDNETILSTDEGMDFISNDVTWLSFDDALINIQTGQYAPLIGLSNTDERTQNGTPVIGEAIANIAVLDGASLAGDGIEVADIQISDPDGANGGPQVLTLTGADAAFFTIQNIGGMNELFLTGGGPLSFTNFEVKPVYHVTVNIADSIGGSSINYTLNITDLNDNAPVFASGSRVNVEGSLSTDTIVYRAETDDLDTTGEVITYTLSGLDAAAFTLVDGELRFVSSPSFAAPTDVGVDNIYNVTIDATDGVNSAAPKDVAIHVTAPAANVVNGTAASENLFGTAGIDIINGFAGDDALFGGDDNDELYGGDNQDTLIGNAGADFMDGGENSDLYFVDASDLVQDSGTIGFDKAQIDDVAGVSLDLTGWSGVERVNGDTGNDTIDASSLTVGITLSGGDGNDILTGGSGNDILLGGAGNDTLSGGAGNDTIVGGANDDLMSGGDGDDIFFIDESLDVVTDGGTGFDKAVISNAAGLTVDIGSWTSVERINGFTGDDVIDGSGLTTGIVMSASDGNDTLTGGSGDDTFYAGMGEDTVNGGAGNDALIGNAGSDILTGGLGDDFLLGGTEADTFVFADGFGQDRVRDFFDVDPITGTPIPLQEDFLDFVGVTSVISMADLILTQDGADTVITLAAGGTDQILLDGVDVTWLGAEDFVFA